VTSVTLSTALETCLAFVVCSAVAVEMLWQHRCMVYFENPVQ
jgi:hypothetical protein